MRSFRSLRKLLWIGLLSLVVVLTACGGGTSSPEPTNPPGPATTATVGALIHEMTFVVAPTVKAGVGSTVEVDGVVKNGIASNTISL